MLVDTAGRRHHGPIGEMRIAARGRHLAVPEEARDRSQLLADIDGDRRVVVAEVMKPEAIEPGTLAHPMPDAFKR